MNAEQFLNDALGGNMNISTLKPAAWHEIMEQYARHKITEDTTTNSPITPCDNCGSLRERIAVEDMCPDCLC